jgi:O-antigen biosynthesis protein WbqP
MSTPKLLAKIDAEMIDTLTWAIHFDYIIKTVLDKAYGYRVKFK